MNHECSHTTAQELDFKVQNFQIGMQNVRARRVMQSVAERRSRAT
jgi:hypothetical protein